MLGKLLKHEIKSQGRSLFLFWGLIIGLALFVRIFTIIEEHISVFRYLSAISIFIFVIAIISSLIYCFFLAVKNFYKKVLREEGYLTNTLPVKKSSIILSFVITDILAIIVTALFSLLGCFIAFVGQNEIKDVWEIFSISIEKEFNMNVAQAISIVLGTMLLSYINTILMFYASMAIGHSFSQNKIPSSIGIGVAFYMAYQVLNVIGMIIIFISNHMDITSSFETNTIPDTLITATISHGFIVTGILIITSYLFTNYFLNKKLNLE